jgi:putative peptide zinc metalloprotease protein
MVRLVEGIELIGKVESSGYKNATYLIKAPNNKYIELTELLYRVVEGISEHDFEYDIAQYVSRHYDKTVDVHAIRFLVDTRLRPLGIISDPHFQKSASENEQSQPDHAFALKMRMTLLNEKITARIATFFSPLFSTIIMLGVFVDFILLNIWLFGYHGIQGSLQESFDQPFTFLLIVGLLLFSTLFHEFGHASGCAHGGAKPGRIGTGLYFIWPAFFTDITDIYRLNRKGKLKSDIGGIYFNCIFALIIAGAYFVTGFEPLLLVIALQNLSIVNQLLPFIRLDGYYIVSDIVGLPDLFSRIKPVLKNVFLRKPHPATKHLKTWVKVVIALWVVVTIPAMAAMMIYMLINSPFMFYMAWTSAASQVALISDSFAQKNYFLFGVQLLQIMILALPIASLAMLFYSLGKQILGLNDYLKYKDTANQQMQKPAVTG